MPTTVPEFLPTNPPATVSLLSLNSTFPCPVGVAETFPKAWEFAIVAPVKFIPTSPPAVAFDPVMLTLPVANDDVIEMPVPAKPFTPTSPPALAKAPPVTLPLA